MAFFHTVYLWDAQARLAPLLLLVGAFGSWLTVDMLRWQTFHRSLDVALRGFALFHINYGHCSSRAVQPCCERSGLQLEMTQFPGALVVKCSAQVIKD